MLWTYLLFKNLKFTECMCVDAMAYKKKVLKITKSLYITHSAQTTALPLLFCHFQDNRGGVRTFSRGGKEVFFTLSHFSTWLSILKNSCWFGVRSKHSTILPVSEWWQRCGSTRHFSRLRNQQLHEGFTGKQVLIYYSKFDDNFLWQGKPEPVLIKFELEL